MTMLRRARPLLGTMVEIQVAGSNEHVLHQAISAAFAEVARLHCLMSFHEPGSDVYRLNSEAKDRPVEVAPETYQVLETAAALHAASCGLFDISIAAELVARRQLPDLHRVHANGTRVSARDIELLPDRRVRFARPLLIDLGGIAKGYVVDQALAVLSSHPEVGSALINAGGDIRVSGTACQSIHIRHPLVRNRLLPPIRLRNAAIASSAADGALAIEALRGPHANPLQPDAPTRHAAASVVSPTCMLADGLTKVVMAGGPESASVASAFGSAAMTIDWNGTIRRTASFPGFESCPQTELPTSGYGSLQIA